MVNLQQRSFLFSLKSDLIKSQSCNKFDTFSNYDDLLRKISMVNKQLNLENDNGLIKIKTVYHFPNVDGKHEILEPAVELEDPTNRREIGISDQCCY